VGRSLKNQIPKRLEFVQNTAPPSLPRDTTDQDRTNIVSIIRVADYVIFDNLKGVHKRRSHSGGRGFVQCGQRARRVLQMRTSSLFDAKNFGIFEIYGVSARTRRVEPVRTFCGQWGRVGQFFAI